MLMSNVQCPFHSWHLHNLFRQLTIPQKCEDYMINRLNISFNELRSIFACHEPVIFSREGKSILRWNSCTVLQNHLSVYGASNAILLCFECFITLYISRRHYYNAYKMTLNEFLVASYLEMWVNELVFSWCIIKL